MHLLKRILIITGLVVVLFFCEAVFENFFEQLFHPNLLILLVIFVDLHLGIRYGIFTAILAGLLKDSFSSNIFGLQIISYLICVYATTLCRRYLFYDIEFGFLRVLMAFLISMTNVIVYYALLSFFHTPDIVDIAFYVLFPEVLATTLVSIVMFRWLKLCVLRLSV